MPDGFRGRAAERFLTVAGNAMTAATSAHNQRPLNQQAGVVRPAMPPTPNARILHEPSSAHIGRVVTGTGTSANVVVSSMEYNNIVSRINRIDDEMGRTLHQISVRIEAMCRGDFVLPQTVERSNRITGTLKNALTEYQRVTDESLTEIRRFTNNILNIR